MHYPIEAVLSVASHWYHGTDAYAQTSCLKFHFLMSKNGCTHSLKGTCLTYAKPMSPQHWKCSLDYGFFNALGFFNAQSGKREVN